MLYVLDKFRICEDMDFENQGAIVGLMKDVVTYLKEDKIPNEKYTINDIKIYLKSLIDLQRKEEIVKNSWSVAPEPQNTPEDEEVDFHFFPTYLAVATLSLAKQKYPEITEEIPGYMEALKLGMEYAVSNKFNGFGFNSNFQRLEAAILLSKGDVAQFLLQNPTLCPDLLQELKEVLLEVTDAVKNKKIINDFGINLGNEYKAILIGLDCLK
ncbi:MAG: hypothetical protein JXR64_00075 [Spirochaetales bacterium]|nr:hypothetical protein [Spirochaetales bacterium]